MPALSQRTRLAILLAYIAVLFVTCKLALGTWIPPTSAKGLWFYSGLASLLLGSLLVTPFFTKPADAVSYTVAGITGLLAVNFWTLPTATSFDRTAWLVTLAYVASVCFSGVVSIALKDSMRASFQRVSHSLFAFCDIAGGPRSIFSVISLFAVVVFHRDSPREFLAIGAAWALVVGLRPLESLGDLVRRWIIIWQASPGSDIVGEIIARQSPNIALLRQLAPDSVPFGSLVVLPSASGSWILGLVLDYVGWSEGRWLRMLELGVSARPEDLSTRLIESGTATQYAFLLKEVSELSDATRTALQSEPVMQNSNELVGLVAVDTDISKLRFEVVRTDLDLEEGRLVEVRIGRRSVVYQIINGLTKEEIVQQKNMFGYVRADAKKIGSWDSEKSRFEVVRWVPTLNEPVFLVKEEQSKPEKEAVGHFPGTSHAVRIYLDQLVTHNTAILGILGVGKSFLALELVERLVHEKIKVVCLDLTNQYAQELKPYYDAAGESKSLDQLSEVGKKGKDSVQQNVEEGGSIKQFKEEIQKDLKSFLNDGNRFVKIYNPVTMEVWRQDSKPFQGRASMASLTPTEVTRIITESLLELLQDQLSDKPRACVVFEEAHSLIPEWSAVASEGDKTATNGTAKAILQGRKYGLGCIVVTQRTANVTKSILNQCSTVFALRVFDATGMEFLKNYIGEDYAAVLSTLEDRHAVVFGRASSCRNPVLIRLNDREDILKIFRSSTQDQVAPAGAQA